MGRITTAQRSKLKAYTLGRKPETAPAQSSDPSRNLTSVGPARGPPEVVPSPFPPLAYHLPKPLIVRCLAAPLPTPAPRHHGHRHGDPAAMLARAPRFRARTPASLLPPPRSPPCRSLPSPEAPPRQHCSQRKRKASRPGLLPEVPNPRGPTPLLVASGEPPLLSRSSS